MKHYFILLVFMLSGLSITAQRNLKPYYFNLSNFETPKVYHFECLEKQEESFYFLMKADGDNLITEVYSSTNYLQVEKAIEHYDKAGAKLDAFILFFPDQQDEILELETQVIGESSYAFRWRNDGPFGWTTSLEDTDTFQMNRQVAGKTKVEILGRQHKCIQVVDLFTYNGQAASKRTAYYSKRIGFCGYDVIEHDFTIHYRVTNILTIEEWEALK